MHCKPYQQLHVSAILAANDILNQGAPNIFIAKGKGKAVPLQAWIGPEGSRKLKFPDILTTAQDGGKVVSLRHRPHLYY
jgi:hypothetical protein